MCDCRDTAYQRRMLTGERGRRAVVGKVPARRQAEQEGVHASVRERHSSAMVSKAAVSFMVVAAR